MREDGLIQFETDPGDWPKRFLILIGLSPVEFKSHQVHEKTGHLEPVHDAKIEN